MSKQNSTMVNASDGAKRYRLASDRKASLEGMGDIGLSINESEGNKLPQDNSIGNNFQFDDKDDSSKKMEEVKEAKVEEE